MKKPHLILLYIFIVIFITMVVGAYQNSDSVLNSIKIDTWGHFISFFALTVLLHSLFKIELLNTGICLIFYAAASELGQFYLGFRNGEMSDFIADVVGVVLFMFMKWMWLVYGKNTYRR